MGKPLIFQVKGVIASTGKLREGKTKNGEDYAARTVYIDPQDGSKHPMAFDFYRQGEQVVWTTTNFKFEEGDMVNMNFTIQSDVFVTERGVEIPKTKLRVWKIEPLNKDGRLSPKKPIQHTEASDEEMDLPF